jgi:2-polyprenyl-6-hydroxyphenyl methylase/3-demethylubiquinone-9 3-methyltransferase
VRADRNLGRRRNDPAQYEELAPSWWDPHGPLAMLHWIAKARAEYIPPAGRQGAVLVDLGCGAGLLAPHLAGKGYLHLGIDLSASALEQAAEHGVSPIRADVAAVPLPEGIADVVSAGEILEHVSDLRSTVDEACRLLRPGGLLVLDTIARTRLARLVAVEIAERVPGGAPRGIHDPRLFVDRNELKHLCADHGVALQLSGLRPSFVELAQWHSGRRPDVAMRPTFSTAVLFQGRGRKSP